MKKYKIEIYNAVTDIKKVEIVTEEHLNFLKHAPFIHNLKIIKEVV